MRDFIKLVCNLLLLGVLLIQVFFSFVIIMFVVSSVFSYNTPGASNKLLITPEYSPLKQSKILVYYNSGGGGGAGFVNRYIALLPAQENLILEEKYLFFQEIFLKRRPNVQYIIASIDNIMVKNINYIWENEKSLTIRYPCDVQGGYYAYSKYKDVPYWKNKLYIYKTKINHIDIDYKCYQKN